MRMVYIIFAMFLLSGCFIEEQMLYKPYPMADLPKGSPDFTQGWQDGCKTGFSSYGNPEYKMIYNFTQDTTKIKPDEKGQPSVYHKAWRDGYNYCRHYSQVWSKPMFSGDGFIPMDKLNVTEDNPFTPGDSGLFGGSREFYESGSDFGDSIAPGCGSANNIFC